MNPNIIDVKAFSFTYFFVNMRLRTQDLKIITPFPQFSRIKPKNLLFLPFPDAFFEEILCFSESSSINLVHFLKNFSKY